MSIVETPPTTPPTEELQAPPHATGGRLSLPVLAPGRYLVVEQGGDPSVFALGSGVVHLGRGFSNHVHLEDPQVSRRHAIIVRRPTGHRVLDDRSHNGTFVNGTRITEAELQDGDVVRVGNVALRYLVVRPD